MRSIPPQLLQKIKEQNQTIYNDANPKMSIQVSRAKDTVMDSTYWTTEIIREKEGIGDLSVAARRQKPYGRPNRLYNIYVDNGTVKTSIREYPDYQNLKWQYQFDVGTGTACAIAFDGFWELYRNKWQMVTSEKPWIFWVDGAGKLWAQFWNEIDTKTELATGVSKVKSIRGWRNINMPLVDQGVVAGYIKTDGKVYYRNYSYQSTGEYAWENERQIVEFTETAVNLNLFITNDYRMGFVIEDSSGKIHLFITERAWAGMAIAPEFVQARVGGSIELIEIEMINAYHPAEYISASVGGDIQFLYAMADNSINYMENIAITLLDEEEEEYQNYGFRIYAKLKHDLTELDYLDFSLKDSNNAVFAVMEVEKIGRKEYLFSTANFNNAYGDLTLTFLGSGNTKGEAEQNVDSFGATFTPINLAPTLILLPEVEEIYNDGPEGKKIVIKFTEPLTGDVDGNESAFTVTGQEHSYTDGPDHNGPLQSKTYTVASVSNHQTESNAILLEFNDGFKNAIGDIAVNYNHSIGTLAGAGGSVESFEDTFLPTDLQQGLTVNGYKAGTHEHVEASIDGLIEFRKLIKSTGYMVEYIEASITGTIQLRHIDDINP